MFADELLFWWEWEYEYIEAPWIFTAELSWLKTKRVGNGGISLRKAQSLLSQCTAIENKPDRLRSILEGPVDPGPSTAAGAAVCEMAWEMPGPA